MRFKVVGSKRDVMAVVVKNKDANTIFAGAPLVLQVNGTDDGLAVTTTTNLAAALQSNFFGVAYADIVANAYGEAQVFGFNDATRLRVTTRAASTDVWASYPAGGIGDILELVTGTGTAAASISADQAFSNKGSGAFSIFARARLGQTYASATTQASSLNASQTASFATVKAMIHAM